LHDYAFALNERQLTYLLYMYIQHGFLPASLTRLRARAVPSIEACGCAGSAAEELSNRKVSDTIVKICATEHPVSLERLELYSLQLGTISGAVLPDFPSL
jgi:hypothetical protein